MGKKKFQNKLISIIILLIIVFSLLGYLIVSKTIQFPRTTESPEIESEEQAQQSSEELTESLRNISETLKSIENILG